MTKIFTRGIENFVPVEGKGSVVTIGTFDGIHRGHQEILRRVKRAKEASGLEGVLITFHPHPRVVLSPENIPIIGNNKEPKRSM